MSGPHAIWDDKPPSEAKRKRVTSGRTLADLAAEVGYSVSQLHRFEVVGRGSSDLRRRIAQVLGLEPIPPAGGSSSWLDAQLVLPWATSS